MAKSDLCEQDLEDYEQELRIREWLDQVGHTGGVDLVHINRNGRARNTLVRASFSLDQQITHDSDGTFADLIEGSPDGASSLGGFPGADSAEEPPGPDAEATLDAYFAILGFNEEETEWLIEKLKSWEKLRQARSRRYQIDSESWELLTNFEE